MSYVQNMDLWQSAVLLATMSIMIWQVMLQRREQRNEAYRRVGQDYVEFLRMCFQEPQLDLIDLEDATLQVMDTDMKRKVAAYSFMFNSWEHAFLLHRDGLMPESQWKGWDTWIKWFLTKKLSCLKAWKLVGQTYDENFDTYIEGILPK